MKSIYFAAPLLAAMVAASAMLVTSTRTSRAEWSREPSPGQLTILDKAGKPAGLCPLKQTDVVADIAGYVGRVTVTQEFRNPSSQAVEAIYTFPLPSDAAVDDMTMTVGSRLVRGEIRRREEAQQIYQDARNAGKVAALLDQERPNIFTQSVANIMPGEKVKISIRYVQVLKYQEGSYEFVFPMVVGPRNLNGGTAPVNSGGALQPATVAGDPGSQATFTDPHKISPPITPKGTRAGHNISMLVHIDAGVPMGKVHSTGHEIDLRREGMSGAYVRLRNADSIPNRDFILKYQASGAAVQSGLLAYSTPKSGRALQSDLPKSGPSASASGVSGYFTLIVQPPSAPAQSQVTPKEMVFVIDQTGSQSGAPIAKAKETMRHCIQNLNPGDTFQLLGFNTSVYPCFPKPVEANKETIAAALAYLEPLQGAGGTDILKAADYALLMPDDPDRLRIICFMTDGYVGNDMQIIDYVKKNRGRARMFPFGVGTSVNRFLIEGMAREGRGAAEFVDLNDPGEASAARFYHRVASPLLRDISVDWNGVAVEDVYPKQIPDLFSAGPVVLKGRYTQAAEGDIVVHGLLRGKPWSQTVHVSLPAVKPEGAALATLWAREKIEDLQSEDWLGAQLGNPKPEIKEQIVATALEYRLMSQFTSFVAVENRVVNVGGKSRRLDVPVEMPQGVSYDGLGLNDDSLASVRLNRGMMLGKTSRSYKSSDGRSRGGVGLGGSLGANGPAAAAPQVFSLSTADPVPTFKEQLSLGDNVLKQTAEAVREAKDGKLSKDKGAALVRAVKLSDVLSKLAKSKKSVAVLVRVEDLPNDGLAKLKAAGFKLETTLKPGSLLLGTISVEKLDALVALKFVVRVEEPRFR